MHLRLERWASPIRVKDDQLSTINIQPLAQHRFTSRKPSMPILPATSTSSRASRLRLAARHSNVESGGRFGPFQRGPQSATANSPATSVRTEQVGRSAPRTARTRSPLLCLVIGSSKRTAGSPAMPVAFFESNGYSNMKRAFPRSQRVSAGRPSLQIGRCARGLHMCTG
jgi:hypothetical protein